MEEISCSFAVIAGYNRGVDIDKPSFLKKGMDGPADSVSDPGHGPKGIGPGSNMGNSAQKLKGVPFFL
jgi:hypothetical protein